MKNNIKKTDTAAIVLGAGVCFLLAGLFNKDTPDIVLGCAWVCIAALWGRENRK